MTFEERPELPVYQQDVRVFEVFLDGGAVGLFLFDPYARESKQGGAWMNEYVSQSHLLNKKPVVGNHQNIVKPPKGEATLLTLDEVTTMFHEFGHALHSLLSNVKIPAFLRHQRAKRLRRVPVTGARDVGDLARSARELCRSL